MFMRCVPPRACRHVYGLSGSRLWTNIRGRRYETNSSVLTAKTDKSNNRTTTYKTRSFLTGLLLASAVWVGYQYIVSSGPKDSFVSFELVARTPVSSTASIFYLRPKNDNANFKTYEQAWKQGIWNFHFKQPQLQIIRAYTPLPPIDSQQGDIGTLRFLIRNDPHGEVSSYLHKLPLGAVIEMRGPNLEYHIAPKVKKVVFYAGGTGIAPALQVAHALLEDANDQPAGSDIVQKAKIIHIFWANKRREDCLGAINEETTASGLHRKSMKDWLFGRTPHLQERSRSQTSNAIVGELENLKAKYPDQVFVNYFVDEESSFINEEVVCQSLKPFQQQNVADGQAHSDEEQQIIVSGPDGFVAYLAGPKEWRGGREDQGVLTGLLGKALADETLRTHVWKV